MIPKKRHPRRRGSVLPLVALCCVVMMGMVALAIDIGMVALARNQCQNAADAAAMAGARTINGDSSGNYNFNAVPSNAVKAAIANKVFATVIPGDSTLGTMTVLANDANGKAYYYETGKVKVKVGGYSYVYNDANPSQEAFQVQTPKTDTTEPYSAVESQVSYSGLFSFGRVFGVGYDTNATATAVHRPRDVMIIMDLSGSMRFESLPGVPLDSSGDARVGSTSYGSRAVSMNPESVFPQFGHYSNTSLAALQGLKSYQSNGGEVVALSNISTKQDVGDPIIEDFYQNAVGVAPSSGNRAFSRTADSLATAPGGDNYLKKTQDTDPTNFATTVANAAVNAVWDSSWEANGYQAYRSQYNGYTQGPGYWGKTFFIWPPDPRGATVANPGTDTKYANFKDNGAKDWRQRFFIKVVASGSANGTAGTMGWLDHNSILWNTSTGALKAPGTTTTVTEGGNNYTYYYRINYAAIFQWLFNDASGTNPFPSTLQAGRIRYYTALPDPSDTNLNYRFWRDQTLTDNNEQFWRDYVNYVLGVDINGNSSSYNTYTTQSGSVAISGLIGGGNWFQWNSLQIKQRPDATTFNDAYLTGSTTSSASSGTKAIAASGLSAVPLAGDFVRFGSSSTRYTIAASPAPTKTAFSLTANLSSSVSSGSSINVIPKTPPYMYYADNPLRPRHQWWFNPMTFVDWLGNYETGQFWWPGNCHEAQAWACKAGIQTALDDIKKNHPSDFIGLAFFSSPKYSASGGGHHNQALVPLGRNYQQLKDSLWFPPSTVTGSNIGKEISPYDADMDNVPRANGGTAPGMAFMITYNQFSSSTTNLRFYSAPSYQLPSTKTPNYRGFAGGLGRKGASKLIIFETDGSPNTRADDTLKSAGADSYYPIRIGNPVKLTDSSANTEWPNSGTYSGTEIYNVVKQICALDTANPPGFSTTRKPMQIHAIGYGNLFDPVNKGTEQTNALNFLQTVQYHGNTASDTTGSNFATYKRIYGKNTDRVASMQTAFTNIMQAGVQVSLIK